MGLQLEATSMIIWSMREIRRCSSTLLVGDLEGEPRQGGVVLKDKSECNITDDDFEERVKWRRMIRRTEPTTIWNEEL